MKVTRSDIARFDASNREAALIVLADSERYPGAMQEWAKLTLQNRRETTRDISANAQARNAATDPSPRPAVDTRHTVSPQQPALDF